MFKYKLNDNIDEQTCLSYHLVHTRQFSSHPIESGLYCMTLCILYYVRRKGWKLDAGRSWARTKLQRNLPKNTHRSSSNTMAIRIYVYSTVPTCKMSPLFFLWRNTLIEGHSAQAWVDLPWHQPPTLKNIVSKITRLSLGRSFKSM